MHPRFSEWIALAFDHPILEPQWHFDLAAEEFQGSDSEIATLITETFRTAGQCLRDFSNAQVGQGLNYLVSPACSGYMFSLRDEKVPLELRLQGIDSIFTLYEACFQPRCTPTLAHLDEPGSSPMNGICYMFWDICAVGYLDGYPDEDRMRDAVISVLDRTMEIEHPACIEGALHGLGEMIFDHGDRVVPIIDRYLSSGRADERLQRYAKLAREGNIL